VAFKLIPKQARPLKQKPPTIAIGPPGRLSLSVAAVDWLTRDYFYEYVLLFWDGDLKRMAIRPTKKKDPRAFRITYFKSGRNAAIAAKNFCELIGYDYSRNRSYIATWNEAEPGFEIDLQSGAQARVKTVSINQKIPLRQSSSISPVDLATWYTRTEARERLRMGQSTLDRFVSEGRIRKQVRPCPNRKSPGRRSEVVYSPDEVDKLADRMRRPREA
jgi:hypothetical protein